MRRAPATLATVTLAAFALMGLAGCHASRSLNSMTTYDGMAGVKIDTLALLPVRSSGGYEGFNRTSEGYLESALGSQHGGLTLVTAQQARDRLSEADLAESLSNLVEHYDRTGVLDQGVLASIGRALKAGHILHVSASYEELPYEDEFRQRVLIEGRIMSVEQGDVVWEGSAIADNPVEGQVNPEQDPQGLIRRTAQAFVSEIPYPHE